MTRQTLSAVALCVAATISYAGAAKAVEVNQDQSQGQPAGAISADLLDQLGLGGSTAVSDEEGNEIRGKRRHGKSIRQIPARRGSRLPIPTTAHWEEIDRRARGSRPQGPVVRGSASIFVNSMPSSRVNDYGKRARRSTGKSSYGGARGGGRR